MTRSALSTSLLSMVECTKDLNSCIVTDQASSTSSTEKLAFKESDESWDSIGVASIRAMTSSNRASMSVDDRGAYI